MKYQALKILKVKTTKKIIEVQPGQIISFSSEKARPFVEKGKIRPLYRPYIERCGTLVVPFDCDLKYHYWKGGQSVMETLKEIEATADVIGNYKWKLN